MPASTEAPPQVTGYRDNVGPAVETEAQSPGIVERLNAKQAAAYVHRLERRAKIEE